MCPKHKICDFMTQVQPISGGKGVNLVSPQYMVSYNLPIDSTALKAKIKERKKICDFYDPSLTHKGKARYKSD